MEQAFKDGLSVMAWEVNAVIALIIMALFFLPRFLRTGITTVPQFLEQRYDTRTQSIANTIFLLAYALILIPLILYSGARGLIDMMDLSSLTGIEDDSTLLRLTTIIIGIGGLLYARFGGLRTLAVLDTINGIGLLIGGFTIAWLSINAVGDNNGIAEGWKTLNEVHPERLDSTGDKDFGLPLWHPISQALPSLISFTGALISKLFSAPLEPVVWPKVKKECSSLAASNSSDHSTSLFPGIVAYHLYASDGIRNDQAYGTLVRNLLPRSPHRVFCCRNGWSHPQFLQCGAQLDLRTLFTWPLQAQASIPEVLRNKL
jgi:SSS family solute:Na+ symporter